MAIYRNVQMAFWTDTKICDNFSPNEKYMYLYLMTNSHTNLCGCYEVSIKQIVFETGLDKKNVTSLLDSLKKKGVIDISDETNELLLVNWYKYNWTASAKFRKSLEENISEVKFEGFRRYLLDMANGIHTTYSHERYGMHTVSDEGRYGMDTTVTDTVTVTVTDTVSVTDSDTDTVTDKKCEKEFEVLWKLYPKKHGKSEALKKYIKARKDGVAYDAVERGIKAYVDYIKAIGTEYKYVKDGDTFFRQRAWEDDWSYEHTGIAVQGGAAQDSSYSDWSDFATVGTFTTEGTGLEGMAGTERPACDNRGHTERGTG